MIVRELITLLGFKLEDGPVKQYDKEIDATKAKSNGLAKAAGGIGTAYKVAAAAVAIGVGWISKNILEATMEMEGYRSQIQAFTGDADSAAKALAELRNKTIDPLFGTGNLVKAYKQLQTLGMSAQDTSRMIDVMGDVANGSVENFNSLGSILTRVSASGKANEGTIRQLTQAGFGMQDMAQGLGISVSQLEGELKAGKIGFNELTRALEGSTKEGGRFYQNAQKQAKTLSGSIKILKDVIGSMGDAIGTGVLPGLVDMIGYITDLIRIQEGGIVDAGIKAFNYLIHVISQVIIFFEVLGMRMKKFGGPFTALKGIFKDVFGFLKSTIESASPLLMNLMQLLLMAFRPIQAFIKPILEALKPVIKDVFGFMADIVAKLFPVMDGSVSIFQRMGEAIGGIVSFIWKWRDAFIPILTAMAAMKIYNGVLTAYSAIIKTIQAATKIWSVVQWALNGAMNANPIGLIILGIGALIGIIILVVKHFDKIKVAFSAVGDFILGKISALVSWFKTTFPNLAAFIGAVFEKIKGIISALVNAVKPVIDAMINVFRVGFTGVVNIFKAIGNAIKGIFSGLLGIISSIFWGIVNTIKTILGTIIGTVVKIVDGIIGIWSGSGNIFEKIFNTIKLIFSAAWDGMKVIAQSVINSIMGVLQSFAAFFEKIWQGLAGIAGAVLGAIKNTWAAIGGFFAAVFNAVKGIVLAVVNFISKNALNIVNILVAILFPIAGIIMALVRQIIKHWDVIGPALKKIWDAVIGVFKAVWEKIVEIARIVLDNLIQIVATVVEKIKQVWQGIVGIAKAVWVSVKAGFTRLVEDAKNIILVIVDFIRKNALKIVTIIGLIFFTIPTLIALVVAMIIKNWDKIKAAIIKIVTTLVNKIKQLWTKLVAVIKSILENLVSIVRGVIEKIKQVWQGIVAFIQMLMNTVRTIFQVVWNAILQFVTTIIDGIKAGWQGFLDFITALWNGIRVLAGTVWGGIKDVFFTVIEAIKTGWQGFVDFFAGLFTWIGEMAAGVWGNIRDTFIAVFDGIKEKFLGFISVIQAGWEKVKGFFGGIGEGVVKFLGGDKGGDDKGSPAPAAAAGIGGPGGGGLAAAAMQTAAAQNTYNAGGDTSINSTAQISVNVPQGTTADQARAISKQVDQAVQDSLAAAIGGSRGTIPSPEARRN